MMGWSVKATVGLALGLSRMVQKVSEHVEIWCNVEECHIGSTRVQKYSSFELLLGPFQLNSVTYHPIPCSLSFWLMVISLLGPMPLGQEQ